MDEIVHLDIEYLKSGHESFVCSECQWNSNNVDKMKDHLSNHGTTENKHANLIDKPDDANMKARRTPRKQKMIRKRRSLTGMTIMMSMVSIFGLRAVMLITLNKMKKHMK